MNKKIFLVVFIIILLVVVSIVLVRSSEPIEQLAEDKVIENNVMSNTTSELENNILETANNNVENKLENIATNSITELTKKPVENKNVVSAKTTTKVENKTSTKVENKTSSTANKKVDNTAIVNTNNTQTTQKQTTTVSNNANSKVNENKTTTTITKEKPKTEQNEATLKKNNKEVGEKYVINEDMITKMKTTIEKKPSTLMQKHGYTVVVDSSITELTNQFTYSDMRLISKLKDSFGTIKIYARDFYIDGEYVSTQCFIY